MGSRSFQTGLLKSVAWLAFALLALIPLSAEAHRSQAHETPPTENQGDARLQRDPISAAAHVVTQSCPGNSDGSCCCRRWSFASSTVKPMAAKPALWVVAPPSPVGRLAQLLLDEVLPSQQSLPSSPPRAPPFRSL